MSSVTTNSYSASFQITSFAKADPTLPYRLVGSFEYANSLDYLERLYAQSTPEQIQVYDKMLENRPEFSYFSGTSIAGLGGGVVAIKDPAEVVKFKDKFKKRGLFWMTALAKIELGATAAAYGKSKSPFEMFPPNRLDFEPFMQLMLDDTETHLKALASDPQFVDVCRASRIPDTWTLAYLRRLKMLRDMINVLKTAQNPLLHERLAEMEQGLKRAQRKLTTAVENFQSVATSTSNKTETIDQVFDIPVGTTNICKDVIDNLNN